MKTNQFTQAVRFIYDNIDNPFTLEDMASQIGISLASLKRLFQEAVEQSPGTFIRRLRMELAFHSLQNKNISIIETAMRAGFEDHSAFTRCFKKTFGYAPKHAKEKINLVNELESVELAPPSIIYLDSIPLQCITKTGVYFESAPQAWSNLQDKLNQTEISDDFSGVFIGIGHDNPHEGKIAEDKVRFSACVSHIERNIGIENFTIPTGKYAKFYFHGKLNNLGLAYHYIYGTWSESSSEVIKNINPAFTMLDELPDSLRATKVAIYVPLK